MPRVKTPKPPPIPESAVQRQAIALLALRGCIVHRRNTGASVIPAAGRAARRFIRFNDPGASDLWGLLGPGPAHGSHYEAEIKRRGGRPGLEQARWLMEHNGVGGSVAWWADSIESMERILEHVLGGGRIEYSTEARLYSVKVKGGTVKVPGPCGDFTLV